MNTIKFYYNGLKINGGNLQRCFYSKGNYFESSGIPMESIKIYSKELRFSKEIKEFFTVKNDSDSCSTGRERPLSCTKWHLNGLRNRNRPLACYPAMQST